jgi:hypothetical protein
MSARPDTGGIDTINFLIELNGLAATARNTLASLRAMLADDGEK